MATKRRISPARRIFNVIRAALFAWGGIGGGHAGILVAKQLSEQPPEHEIYDPAPRQPSQRHRGRRRGPRDRA
jgi:hypothetical protein